jgi:uroporphyrinogen-III synthase
MIMTRPAGSNTRFVERIAPEVRARLRIIRSPLIEVRGLDADVVVGPQDAAIFTSENGVRFAPPGGGRRAYCVGDRTTRAATANGWDAVCAGVDADALVAHLMSLRPAGVLHHLSGMHVRGRIPERLQAAGLSVLQTAVYDQILLPFTAEALACLTQEQPVLVPLFSPRTAGHFAALAPVSARLHVVAMSDAVAEAWAEREGSEVVVAAEPTARSMLEAIEKRAFEISLG